MNKRAQAQIVTTILLILIVLAAVIIVWQVIDRFVSQGGTAVTTKVSCIDVRLEIVKADASESNVTVTRRTGGENDVVGNIKILVNGAEDSTVTAPSSTALKPLETKTWGGVEMTAGDDVEVAAVLTDSTVCDISGRANAVE